VVRRNEENENPVNRQSSIGNCAGVVEASMVFLAGARSCFHSVSIPPPSVVTSTYLHSARPALTAKGTMIWVELG
jgi:hypothetical protein